MFAETNFFHTPLPHFNAPYFSWDSCNTQEKWKAKAMQNFGGQIRCIMGNVKVGFSENLVVNISVRKIMLEEEIL